MPSYLFVANDGSEWEEYFPFGEAPTVGKRIRRKGKSYKRVMTAPQAKVSKDVHFVAWSQPKHMPGAPHYSKEGFPAFASKRQADEFAALHGGQYGGDG